MLGVPSARRYFLYRSTTDMRKSFNGLSGLVINEMKKELLSGDGFIFINKRRTLIKILVWDRTGFVIYYKKLSSGSLELPQCNATAMTQQIGIHTLMMMLEGVELKGIKLRKRYGNLNPKRA